mmetsp:Transcript_73933/g.149508  ORF Transcript_73933/g.149508 Transcript_73933/m.149508 type:complete len:387 (-) Transcript_73933:286-1446(-)
MPKFPNGSLHKNKPSMNTIHVSIHTRNDPPKPSHKKLTRLGRDIHVAWTTRTRPSNMVKTANVMTTRPNTSVSNIKILGTVQRSRRKRTPCRQSTRLRPRSRKFPNTIPINSVKQTVFKAIKIIVPPSGLTMFVETPSAPSSTDHMLTSTGIINDSKIKNRTRQSMTPFPVSVTDPSMRTKPILQRASRRSRHRRPSQSPPALNTRQNSNQLSSKQHVQVKPTTEKSCPKPDRGASQPPTTHVHTRKKGFAQRQRRSPSNPPISHFRDSKAPTGTHVRFKRHTDTSKQSQNPLARIHTFQLLGHQATTSNHATRTKQFSISGNVVRPMFPKSGSSCRRGSNHHSFLLIFKQANRKRPSAPSMEAFHESPNPRANKSTVINKDARQN